MTTADSGDKPSPQPCRVNWRQRLQQLPPKVWALIVAPVIPVVATAVITGWLDGSDNGKAGDRTHGRPSTPTLVILGIARAEDATLEDYLDDAIAKQRFMRILGCEGRVFAVRMRIADIGDAQPVLRLSLRQIGGFRQVWQSPPGFKPLLTVRVQRSDEVKRVWFPSPDERGSWFLTFALYERATDDTSDAKDTKTIGGIESLPLPPGVPHLGHGSTAPCNPA